MFGWLVLRWVDRAVFGAAGSPACEQWRGHSDGGIRGGSGKRGSHPGSPARRALPAHPVQDDCVGAGVDPHPGASSPRHPTPHPGHSFSPQLRVSVEEVKGSRATSAANFFKFLVHREAPLEVLPRVCTSR